MISATRTAAILAAAIAGSFLGSAAAADNPKTVQVDCNSGRTIASALQKGKEDRSLLVLISGVCNESVVIDRTDVTLRGGPGATINGPDASLNVVEVTADRVTIEGLVVTGGRNGIVANGAGNLAIRGTTVQSTGRTGIIVLGGSGGIVDASTVQSNPRDGVSVDGAQLTLVNSTVRLNARVGVLIGTGGAGRIGTDNANNAAGNLITQNGATGVVITAGGGAIIAANTITLNGADLASTSGRSGISVTAASADIVGGNTIADNTGQGIFIRGASVQIGNPSFPISTVNTITGNGDAVSAGGVFVFLGSTAVIRDAVITGNKGFGLGLTGRSQAQVFSSQFANNVSVGGFNLGDGIKLALGSAVLFNTPLSVSSGNAGAGLLCTDAESSISIPLNSLDAGFGNANGAIVNCTGF